MVVDFPKRVTHGGTGKRQQEKTKKKVLDFSASVNPYPPDIGWHCSTDSLSSYPDDSYHELKERIAHVYHRNPEEICVGNGSIEILRVLCQVELGRLGSRKTFFIQPPTFGEYALSARLAGGEESPDPEHADIRFLCNPNNPTGSLLGKEDVLARLSDAKQDGALLFCDEAFIELSDPACSIADICDPHLFVLRSLTKCFSVPGIRFGYGFGDPDLIERIETARSPWTVNTFAEAYALQALLHMEDLAESRRQIEQERRILGQELSAMGLVCHPSSVNYLLVDCGRNVSPLCEKLSRLDILVRDCTSFGLPSCIRVAVRTREENRILVEALLACMH
ncbi:histidinol-phosphate transaminase [uncultured Methanoregula sp.]|uniref:pyridoxal phosphate-dependent aminotransferase n=1 Tax=uncultured Methanoregula sp. TaxID=1005933 RepID=UPI002AAB3899|nr:histidinol-phosphate transaminase [uncultured Methanoregula sp.]